MCAALSGGWRGRFSFMQYSALVFVKHRLFLTWTFKHVNDSFYSFKLQSLITIGMKMLGLLVLCCLWAVSTHIYTPEITTSYFTTITITYHSLWMERIFTSYLQGRLPFRAGMLVLGRDLAEHLFTRVSQFSVVLSAGIAAALEFHVHFFQKHIYSDIWNLAALCMLKKNCFGLLITYNQPHLSQIVILFAAPCCKIIWWY